MSFDDTKDLNGCHKGKFLKTYLRKSDLKIAGWKAIYWFTCLEYLKNFFNTS